ncbi:universal stress protein [Tahibacter amnicola]|uniref:Universal stress protein n=1 Tax=Tahibacter amnicola TaxID=2976241 RepID=A0ABY6B8S5_9GAMM|nr:universal stress protein [Tahibacter amnicola]UXI65962.1 universal stress protein [Tahibacter amnicola]
MRQRGKQRGSTLESPWSIESYLAWQGVGPLRTTVLRDVSPASLLAFATSCQADLLVMGAYGTHRYSEWLFGGMTLHALHHATVPLFLRH